MFFYYRRERLGTTMLCNVITLQWLRGVFLAYLDAWEKSVDERPGFSEEEKKRMLLSSETRLGLRMTGKV